MEEAGGGPVAAKHPEQQVRGDVSGSVEIGEVTVGAPAPCSNPCHCCGWACDGFPQSPHLSKAGSIKEAVEGSL